MKKYIYGFIGILSGFMLFASMANAQMYTIKSPDGKIEASLEDGEQLKFSLKTDGVEILKDSKIGMETDKGKLGTNAKAKGSSLSSHDGVIDTAWGIRNQVKDKYNQMEIDFNDYKVVVRAYNDAVAYRFITDFGKGDMTVVNEILTLPLADDVNVVAHMVQGVGTSFERLYKRMPAKDMKNYPNASSPFLFEKNGYKVVLVESDWFDYPGMRISYPKTSDSLKAFFASCPKSLVQKGNLLVPDKTEDYIAKTKASRNFPWRGFIIARNDIELADNDTVYKLAAPSKVEDTSWISTGTSVWDWWVNWTTEGVDFKVGFNEDMCRYYIDFAATNKIPFVTFDAGWHVGRDKMNTKQFKEAYLVDENFVNNKPHVNIPALVKYAHSKNVKVVMWVYSKVLYKYPEKALDLYKSWGVDGLKIDFTDRDDQWAIKHFENITKLAAERKMIIDWHGCPNMAGMQRTYPNAVNFEGVYGGEVNKWSKDITPSHNVDLVYLRMLMGPMDYTPGGMRNRNDKEFKISNNEPNVLGTRSHMCAMYILFYGPLQMISDRPSEYNQHPKILKLLASIPTTWDETKALEGELGKYVVVARRKANVWYIGGMCDWNGKKVDIDLSKILPEGSFEAEIICDTVNSDMIAQDYKHQKKTVSAKDKLSLEMKSGGGFFIKLTPKKFFGIF